MKDNNRVEYVCNLAEIRREDVNRAGGKAANLGEMIGKGLPVPGGFTVLTTAYRRFIEAGHLEEEIQLIFADVDGEDMDQLHEASLAIRKRFMETEMPKEIRNEIETIYEQLGSPVVAIRSSATAEDMPGMSFAGQYSTYLNVQGQEDVCHFIKKCWASLWNERSVAYRIKQNISHKNLAHGVVVQTLVNADRSGVLFTADPVTGIRDEVLINSSWGLGEAIVSGEVNPDQWVISKKDRRTIREEIAAKNLMSVRSENGVALIEVDPDLQHQTSLSESEKMELLDLAIQVENIYNYPQDLEWSFMDGKLYLLQTRPVTTLYPIPEDARADDFRVYLNLYLYSQSMPEPFTPMGFEIARFGFEKMMKKFGPKRYRGDRIWWLHNLGGRAYADITGVLKSEKMQDNLKSSNRNDKDPITTKAIVDLVENKKASLSESTIPAMSMGKLINLNLLKILSGGMIKAVYGTKNPVKASRKAKEEADREMARIRSHMKKKRNINQKLELLEEISDAGVMASMGILFYGGISLTYLDKAEEIMKKYLDDTSDLVHVEKAVPNNITTQMGMWLLTLAKEFDQKGKRATAKDPEVIKFLDVYGDKNSSIELEVASRTWREDPSFVVDTINSYIDYQNYDEEQERFSQGQKEAEQAINRITEALTEKAGKRVARKTEKILRNYRQMFGLRELPKYYMSMGISLMRTLLLEIGEILVKEGRISQTEDVFFVTVKDIQSGADLKETVEQNKQEYQRELARPAPPRLLTSTGEAVYSSAGAVGDDSFLGVPVSPGVYEGRVKVLANPLEGNKLERGDILVTTGTNPAWTPLFLKIGALVMETGGPISHGSVVAREYGIPAVVGVTAATSMLQDGQMIRVNGETGIIEIDIDKDQG